MASISHGVTVVFGTSGFEADITDVKPPAMSRDSVETSHQGTTDYKTYIPASLIDTGELGIDFNFDPTTEPPIDQDAETVTLTLPTAVWSFSGFMTNYEGNGPHNDKMTGSATVKLSGAIGITAS